MGVVELQSRPIITVDGLAGSGKTSLARELARGLGYVHLNSGLLYRGVGWLCLEHGVSPDDPGALAHLLGRHSVELVSPGELLVDGVDRASVLGTPEVSEATSRASVFPVVRAFLLEAQRRAFPQRPLIAEGRDMGTVVFPEAALKFFVEASSEVRAARRLAQLQAEQGTTYDAATIEREIIERDRRDSARALSPTRAAPDAVLIDNSSAPLATTVAQMHAEAVRRGLNSR